MMAGYHEEVPTAPFGSRRLGDPMANFRIFWRFLELEIGIK